MRGVLWSIGRVIQVLALCEVGYALLIGINSHSSQQELILLGVGVGIFVTGTLLVRFTGDQE